MNPVCRKAVRFLFVLGLWFLVACAPIRVASGAKLAEDTRLVEGEARSALKRAQVFGLLHAPVTVNLHASHASLLAVAGLERADWLRAWATYDTVELEAPSLWDLPELRAPLANLLVHELTHVVMYQNVGTRANWHKRPLPLWFREGMAIYVAGPGDNALTRADLRAFYLAAPFPGDPVSEGDALVHEAPREVYAAAAFVFGDLVLRFGEDAMRRVLAGLREGRGFQEAWLSATGVPLGAALAAWREELLAGEAGANP